MKSKLIYLYYYLDGIKKQNMGFAVLTQKSKLWQIQICISKLERIYSGQANLEIYNGEKWNVIDTYPVENGKINITVEVPYYSESIRIALTDHKWLQTERMSTDSFMVHMKRVEEEGKEEKKEDKEDKDVLIDIYPTCHPFRNEEIFYSLEPEKIQEIPGLEEMCENSFLMHGFYNYRHIIVKKNEDCTYLLGVPGTYYEREQKVANMYGFSQFRSVNKDKRIGDFGYYFAIK